MKKSYIVTLLTILLTVLGTAAWIIYMAWASTVDPARVQVRAISAAEHAACAALPRGSQEMEERRHGCFKELYTESWTKVD
jgi:hypothetical protein